METAKGREWLDTQTIAIGISSESSTIPLKGTPQFGVAVTLIAPNSDRQDELVCLVDPRARKAIARCRPNGLIRLSGQTSCAKGKRNLTNHQKYK